MKNIELQSILCQAQCSTCQALDDLGQTLLPYQMMYDHIELEKHKLMSSNSTTYKA